MLYNERQEVVAEYSSVCLMGYELFADASYNANVLQSNRYKS